MKTRLWKTIFALLLCGFLSTVTYGDLITIGLTGKVSIIDDPCNHFGGQIHTNDTLTGFYSYDTSAPDSEPSDPSIGAYWYYSAPCGVSVSINSFNFKTDSNNVQFIMGIRNNSDGADTYAFISYNNSPLPNGTLVDIISWQLDDYTCTAFSSDALPTTAPNLADWGMNYGLTISGPGCDNYLIRANVTSVVLIPEPATLFLIALGIAIYRYR